jgi:hypothetical protein
MRKIRTQMRLSDFYSRIAINEMKNIQGVLDYGGNINTVSVVYEDGVVESYPFDESQSRRSSLKLINKRLKSMRKEVTNVTQ